MNLLKPISILFLLSLFTACGDSGGDDDYWTLPEPQLNIFEAGDMGVQKQAYIKDKISDFNESKSQVEKVGYNSNISFEQLGPKIRFDIKSLCQAVDTPEAFVEQTYKNQKVYNKIYLYNYLPEKIINAYAPDKAYKCHFKFTAINKIGSKHEFSLKPLNYSTQASNQIKLWSVQDGDKSKLLEQDIESAYIQEKYLDFSKDIKFKALSKPIIATVSAYFKKNEIQKNLELINLSASLICKNYRVDRKNEVIGGISNNLKEYFKGDHASKNPGYILRSCRISYKFTDKSLALDLPKVWSPFFDVVFQKPSLDIQPLMKYLPKDNYPELIYEPTELVITNLKIKNTGTTPLVLSLPRKPTKAKIHVMTFRTHVKTGYVNAAYDKIVPNSIFKESIISDVFFRFKHNQSNETVLNPNKSVVLEVILNKNFKCQFYENRHSENAFWIKALETSSDEERLKIYANNLGELTEYPVSFYISDLIKAKTFLNPLGRTKTLIDTVFLTELINKKGLEIMTPEAFTKTYNKFLHTNLPKGSRRKSFPDFAKHLKPLDHLNKYCETVK